MTVSDILTPLRDSFAREARGYAKMAPTPEGARPHESTEIQQCCANISGTYRVAAHEINKLIKKYGNYTITCTQKNDTSEGT